MSGTSVHHIRIFKGKDDQFYYESVAANGQVLSTSEGYTQKHNAFDGAMREHGEDSVITDETVKSKE